MASQIPPPPEPAIIEKLRAVLRRADTWHNKLPQKGDFALWIGNIRYNLRPLYGGSSTIIDALFPVIAKPSTLPDAAFPELVAQRLYVFRSLVDRIENVSGVAGNRVFIGHGRSLLWHKLKDFLQEKLKLPTDEFNRDTPVGVPTFVRLEEMLNNAAFAFLIMTGEEERDGKLHARPNVIHEIGLFQGRLGERHAIVMLEQECEEFSNIHGLTQIRFPKGDITARFEQVRDALANVGIVKS